MTNTYELTSMARLQSIETAERYLIARTHAEIADTAGQGIAATMHRPLWAIGVTATIVVLLQMGFIRDFLAATV